MTLKKKLLTQVFLAWVKMTSLFSSFQNFLWIPVGSGHLLPGDLSMVPVYLELVWEKLIVTFLLQNCSHLQ